MNEHVEQTILLIQDEIAQKEAELAEKRRMVNSLCKLNGRPAIYADTNPLIGVRQLRSDEYYGQPLSKAIRMVLTRRQQDNLGPASVGEIYSALIEGGYKFGAKTEDYAKRGLYSALTKNSSAFHRLPNGDYGLLSWYPGIKAPKAANGASDANGSIPEEQEEMAAREADADEATEDLAESEPAEKPNKAK